MTGRSTILDANAYTPDADRSDRRVDGLVERRRRVLGPAYRLFYDEPVRLVRGSGTTLYDADGRAYLDAYNNVACVGHAHPRVAAAVAAQAATLTTHTRYLDEELVGYAEELLTTFPGTADPDGWQVMFACTGSEANDLAVRVARRATGGTGVIVTAEAYHGNTDLVTGMSPALGPGVGLGPDVWTVAAPDPLRRPDADPGETLAAGVRRVLAEMAAVGVRPAALLVDTVLSSDGVHPSPAGPSGLLAPAVAEVRAAGGVLIADEVQPGFARTGSAFWGFERHGLVPELATLGKPMGNGMPIAAVVGAAGVIGPFAGSVPYFNTFGGNQVSIAAARAVLEVIAEEGLQRHAAEVGARLRSHVRELATERPEIADVRGDGLYLGIELVAEAGSTEPGTALARDVVNALRREGVLCSVCGPFGSTLKVRPPLVFSHADADRFAETLARVL
ncbi:aspartate aminotransferase family protein [Nocardioides sp. GY 10113]|uniref:aspartate aminotransferase family protein n=1 Tax=Nocardioides sp. GY 10113 TaxID=2569761 RepID=UPI0010A802AF|nr:aspartate aminotransferase family protein [Nocardioides sp. GY 10113]TIC88871.1 aspartate aminotransferase family protein [Nocardioides sp. GY 10113]